MKTSKEDWNQVYSVLNDASGNPALEWRWQEAIRLLDLPARGRGVRLIDFGCGDGAFLRRLRPLYPEAQFTGVDGADAGLDKARRLLPGSRFINIDLNKPVIADANLLPLHGNFGMCTEVLEHLDDPVMALRTFKSLLDKDARLVITVPGGPVSASDRHFGHRKHYTIGKLRAELETAQFEVQGIWAAGFPFHNLYRLLVLLRGEAAINDQIGTPSGSFSAISKLLFAAFRILFHANLFWPPLGWQLFAVARA
ncbi:MAG TPA: class I SAM-dependent methyltransferase [Xanthobacteraceae bacterium]|nr:class I SAM-dependent methyltransferase [Xanthobacteraceae bacterium]